MQALQEVRSRESNVERQFIPIDDTLDLLAKHGVAVNQLDLGSVQKAKAEWEKLRSSGQKVSLYCFLFLLFNTNNDKLAG